jgi:FkbM family methyltransferase
MSKVFFQIGTNNGNDLFQKKVRQENPDLVILVEPNKSLIEQIEKNYNGISNAHIHIYNNAVYYSNDEEIELYIPAKNGVYGTEADNGITYADAHFSLLPMNDWGSKNDMVKITTKSITFDEICNNHNITEIDFLQIDTEGFDSEIIKMIDFTKYKIKQIRFEEWTFNTDCFTKYNNEKANELGYNGTNEVIKKLQLHNYSIEKIRDSDGNDIIAILR